MNAEYLILQIREIAEIQFKQFSIVVYASTSTQKYNDFGFTHILMQKIDEKINLFIAVLHDNICILKALGNDISFDFLRLYICNILHLSVYSLQADFSEISHSKEFKIFLYHSLKCC
jgi:hypothetical protein